MKLSIITVNLNHRKGLEKTRESIASQTWIEYEWIVVDGGSTDGSKEVFNAEGLQPKHLLSEPDEGLYDAMNKGLRLAKGEYLQFLNSGDIFENPTILETVLGSSSHEEDLIYGDYSRLDSEGKQTYIQSPDELSLSLFFRKGLCHQSVFFKKEFLETVGEYDTRYRIAADWELMVRSLNMGASSRRIPLSIVHFERGGLSDQHETTSLAEREMLFKDLLAPAVLKDAQEVVRLQEQNFKLQETERWLESAQKRSWFRNMSMVSLWSVRKWRGKLFTSQRNDAS